jgi:hypothetical protein
VRLPVVGEVNVLHSQEFASMGGADPSVERVAYANLFIVDTPHALKDACPVASTALYEHFL